jgi:hypothetical protein
VKIVKKHSEGRVKLDSEDNKTIQNEKVPVKKLEVIINRGHKQPVKKLEVIINRGHKQTVAIEGKKSDCNKSTKILNSKVHPEDKISKCDNSSTHVSMFSKQQNATGPEY